MNSAVDTIVAAPRPTARERNLSSQIFAVSAGLVGVCLTVVGLFNIFRRPGEVQSIADNLVAIDALIFLSACLFAYLALRTEHEDRWRRMERYADLLFLFGLSAMVLISGLIAYELL